MTTGTLTRADLTEAVFQAVGLSRTDWNTASVRSALVSVPVVMSTLPLV